MGDQHLDNHVWCIWFVFMPVSAGGVVSACLAFCVLCNLRWHVSGPDFTMTRDALQNPQNNFFGKKIVMAMIDIICLFCEICLCLLRQKRQVVMITLEFKPKILLPRFMFFPTSVIGCCPLFLQDVFAADTSKRKKWMPQNTLLCVAI